MDRGTTSLTLMSEGGPIRYRVMVLTVADGVE